MAKNIWVTRHGDRWAVKREGRDDPLGTHDAQEAATSAARQVAQAEGVELIVQGTDGQIREKSSHGNDPREDPG
jgi:hypothetical protein